MFLIDVQIYKKMDRYEKYGSKYPFEVIWINPRKGISLAYFGQILLLAILLMNQTLSENAHPERTSFYISCLEMLPPTISRQYPAPLKNMNKGVVPEPDWLPGFPHTNGRDGQHTQT